MSKISPPQVRGRIVFVDGNQFTLQNQRGYFPFKLAESSSGSDVSVGDWVELNPDLPEAVRVLTRNTKPSKTLHWNHHVLNPRRIRALDRRAQVEAMIRSFFGSQGFRETRTPLLVPCPGMEPHIRPFRVASTKNSDSSVFLPTSPEFAMKRLLAGGLEKIFQICPAFRDEPKSSTHHPEFTMLEWYRAYSSYEDMMQDTEALFESIALQLFHQPSLHYQGRDISVQRPWPRFKIRDLFLELAGVDLVTQNSVERLRNSCVQLGIDYSETDTWDDLYFRIWLNRIENQLPKNQAVFVTRYPASQAALAVIDSDRDGSKWAKRFEFYIGGLEMGNAFEELTDPIEQRKRFEKDMNLRAEIYGPDFPKSPIDEGFLDALEEGMPPAAGIAVGVDRMVMLYADESEIEWTTWLPSECAPRADSADCAAGSAAL
jgi:lysyl-tRNA synthetase class 2